MNVSINRHSIIPIIKINGRIDTLTSNDIQEQLLAIFEKGELSLIIENH